jgi:hypothetical protein
LPRIVPKNFANTVRSTAAATAGRLRAVCGIPPKQVAPQRQTPEMQRVLADGTIPYPVVDYSRIRSAVTRTRVLNVAQAAGEIALYKTAEYALETHFGIQTDILHKLSGLAFAKALIFEAMAYRPMVKGLRQYLTNKFETDYEANTLLEDEAARRNTLIVSPQDVRDRAKDLNWEELLEGQKVLLLGDVHGSRFGLFRRLFQDVKKLKKAGVTHIGIESNTVAMPLYFGSVMFLAPEMPLFIVWARLNGIKIRGLDEFYIRDNKKKHGSRNKTYGKKLANLTSKPSTGKVIVIAGGAHLMVSKSAPIQDAIDRNEIPYRAYVTTNALSPTDSWYFPANQFVTDAGLAHDEVVIEADETKKGVVDGIINMPSADERMPIWLRGLMSFYYGAKGLFTP